MSTITEIATAIMIQIASAHPEYQVPEELPEFRFVNREQFLERCSAIGDACILRMKRGDDIYDVVFLREGWDVQSKKIQGKIGHELVHYVQWHNGKMNNTRRLELEAVYFQQSIDRSFRR